MKAYKILLSLLFLFQLVTFQSQTNKVPKLVIGIVVDQMRYDYVYKYWDKFSEGGFKKLVNDGFFCRNAVYDYLPTYTGPGHASIYSGTTPSVHGIIGNNWYDYKTKNPVYCAGDWKSQTICFCKKPHLKEELNAGKKSPSLLLSTTIGDELKLKDSLSKVYSLSLKDRSAVLSGGHMADGAFWINSKGKWITSDYYCKKMPSWKRLTTPKTKYVKTPIDKTFRTSTLRFLSQCFFYVTKCGQYHGLPIHHSNIMLKMCTWLTISRNNRPIVT